MTLPEAIETTHIHSVGGLTGDRMAVVTTRRFRGPHPTISDVGLIGSGQIPMPGEVSLAHNGILFPDELPEFRHHVLEVWRQPLEDGITERQSSQRRRFGDAGDVSGTPRGCMGEQACESSYQILMYNTCMPKRLSLAPHLSREALARR
jgi:hypothetical protein